MSLSGWRSPLLAALVALLATAVAGCSTNSDSSTVPTPTEATETFTGTLGPSGTSTYVFYAKSGKVTVTLTAITPDSTAEYGLVIGVWNAYSVYCTPVSVNGSAKQGQSLMVLATATTAVCVQLTDNHSVVPTGGTESFTLTATHF